MGDVSQCLSHDPTSDNRSPSPHLDKNASPSGRRLSDIHIPSPDHSVSILSSEHFDKAGLVAAQEAALHDAAILEMGWTGGDSDEYAFMPEGEKPKSPAIGSLQDLKSLRPIRLRNMKVGKVHRGRILSGTLCCKSVKILAVMNVLEEEGTGDATKFVISNAVPRSATTATAQRLYPEGAQLSVREPYLKRFADGMVGILVENPNDIIFNYLPDEAPSPVSERENHLWPVYKDPSGDGPDTPVLNTYGSFLSSLSLLSRNSLNSPLVPRSPRSFLDDPLDGLTIRTIRKFKSFRKHGQGPDDHADDGKDSPVKLSSGGDELRSTVEARTSTQVLANALGDLSAHKLASKAELSSKPKTGEGLQTKIGQNGDSNWAFSACNPCEDEREHLSSPTGGLVSESNNVRDAEQAVEFGKTSNSWVDRHVEFQVGVDVEEGPADGEAILIGINDQEQLKYRAVSGPRSLQEDEGDSCNFPPIEFAAAEVETVVGTFVEQNSLAKSDTGIGLDTSVVASSVSKQAALATLPETSDVCIDSVAPVQSFLGDNESDEGCVATSRSAEADGVDKEGGLWNGVQCDAASHQTEVHSALRDFEPGKGLGAPIASDVSNHTGSKGCSLPAVETNEKKVDPNGLKSPETVDASIEAELSAAALRMKGNQRFALQDWTGAVELYTRAIHKAVQESKEHMASSKRNRGHRVNGNCVEAEIEVVMDYSNRAEAWLRLHHYERAWADAERALAIDPNHLKSLFRQGRALLGLGDYQQALTHLDSAYARAPFDKDLLAAIKLSRIGDHQSRLGIYEFTDYYLRGRFAGEVPTCADYVGPVQVKAACGDKGRGLFLTKHVEAGDLLVVANPLAMLDSMSTNKNRKISLYSDSKGRLHPDIQERLVHAVRERAKVSTKNRQRLLALCYGEDSAEQPVPSMDLFIPGRRIAPIESLNLEEERITRLIVRNAIDRNMVSTPLEKRHSPPKGDAEDHEERVFWGLWVLPSFINHSCIPNVSMVVIGRALFVYASRDLGAGEELLCSYFNVFQPLPQRRQIASRCWGFTCKCARCLLETRFESSLKKLYGLHSRLEPNPEFVLQLSPYAYKTPAKDLAKELEVIEVSKKLDHRERCWLQASFTQLYTCSLDFMGPRGNYPFLESALHAMQVVYPGCNSTLEVGLLVREKALKESNGKKTSQYKAVNQQVLRICQCIYGKQKTAVLQALIDGSRSDSTIKA